MMFTCNDDMSCSTFSSVTAVSIFVRLFTLGSKTGKQSGAGAENSFSYRRQIYQFGLYLILPSHLAEKSDNNRSKRRCPCDTVAPSLIRVLRRFGTRLGEMGRCCRRNGFVGEPLLPAVYPCQLVPCNPYHNQPTSNK